MIAGAIMILVSSTYWAGMPFWFRKTPEHARVESLVLRAHDQRQLRANYWTDARTSASPPKVGVVVMHPRIDFTHHYAVPRLIDAGFAVLAANTRHAGNDTMAQHEEMVLDLAACVRHLKDRRGVDKVVLLGNCGGGSLAAFYQAQARLPPGERIERTPGGSLTYFRDASMHAADGVIYVAAHRGQGNILLASIDPSVTDEDDALSVDPSLDMYDPANGFREPPAWSEYGSDFVARYRAGQVARVRRIDAKARASIAAQGEAKEEASASGFDARPEAERRAVLRRRTNEPTMVVHRTMANLTFTDRTIEPSARDYGSLLSERPDLMNYGALGLARTCTARAWLSTWSGLSTNADLVRNVRAIAEPTLVVHAERDREVHPSERDEIGAAIAAPDKTIVTIEGARHYFEPELGAKETPHLSALMDVIVPWIQERFA